MPAENDLALVQWASTALLWQVMERGCRIWLSPPPFDHTKLMLVDGLWCAFNDCHMGVTAENIARKYEFSRAEQDAFAAVGRRPLEVAATLRAGRPLAQRGLLAESSGGLVLLIVGARWSLAGEPKLHPLLLAAAVAAGSGCAEAAIVTFLQ